jgi:DNA mismatch endonuclease (patch repair protein)
MVDRLTKEHRSWNMSRIRSRNTIPEVSLRSLLHKMGYRFRLHKQNLPGKPDIVLQKYKTVIFVHGCYWHRHTGCPRAHVPKTNIAYWEEKFRRNKRRDRDDQRQLRKLGWKFYVVWECEVGDSDFLKRKLTRILQDMIRP